MSQWLCWLFSPEKTGWITFRCVSTTIERKGEREYNKGKGEREKRAENDIYDKIENLVQWRECIIINISHSSQFELFDCREADSERDRGRERGSERERESEKSDETRKIIFNENHVIEMVILFLFLFKFQFVESKIHKARLLWLCVN